MCVYTSANENKVVFANTCAITLLCQLSVLPFCELPLRQDYLKRTQSLCSSCTAVYKWSSLQSLGLNIVLYLMFNAVKLSACVCTFETQPRGNNEEIASHT